MIDHATCHGDAGLVLTMHLPGADLRIDVHATGPCACCGRGITTVTDDRTGDVLCMACGKARAARRLHT